EENRSQHGRNRLGAFDSYIWVTVTVATRPKSELDQLLDILCRQLQFVVDFGLNFRGYPIEYIFQIPSEACCFVYRSRFFLFDKRSFSELLQQQVNIGNIIDFDTFDQVIDNTQN